METIATPTAISEFVQKQRIKVLVETFERKGNSAITDIIGTNIILKDIKRLPIVIDGYYVFDVEFSSLSLNPVKFYIIETSTLKLISDYSTDYYAKIDNIPIKINANLQEQDLKKKPKIMVQVNKILSTEHLNHEYFKYYGTIIKNPLHEYVSTLDMKYGYKLNVQENDWKDCAVKIFKDDEIEMEYSKFLSNSMFGKQYSIVQDVDDQKNIISKSIAYRISAMKLINFPIYGIVFVVKKRKHVFDVVVGINNNFSFSYEQWVSMMNFLNTERENYETFLQTL